MTKNFIHSSYLQYLKSLSVKLKEDPKQFWSFHSIKSKKRRIPETVRYNGMPSTDPARKVELFNQFFRTVYSVPSVERNCSFIDVVNPNLLLCIKTTADKWRKFYKILTSQGNCADNVPARILKACSEELSTPLALLFNRSFSLGWVPEQWKLANITPVFKANERDLVENYRSLALLSIPGKCQERIVHT